MNNLLYKVALNNIPDIGPSKARLLLSKFGSEEEVFKTSEKNLKNIQGLTNSNINKLLNRKRIIEQSRKEIDFIKKNNIEILYFTEENYPNRLKNCNDAPLLIFKKGKCNLNKQKVLSIVGTRNATDYGKSICKNLIKDLKENNHDVLIVSGLAYGIDITAHEESLSNGLHTVSVLGHGLNTIYPAIHRETAGKIIKQGCLLSEFTTYADFNRKNFVRRNRIIAGLADATIVVESAPKGGALITADIANSYNRDVFAFPGRINDKFSEGTNKLIKQNQAALIESIKDIEYIMGWEKDRKKKKNIQKKLFVKLNKDENNLVKILTDNKTLSLDLISIKAKMPVSKTAALLLELEFKGLVKSKPGKQFEII